MGHETFANHFQRVCVQAANELETIESSFRKISRDGLLMCDSNRAQQADLDVIMGLPPNVC